MNVLALDTITWSHFRWSGSSIGLNSLKWWLIAWRVPSMIDTNRWLCLPQVPGYARQSRKSFSLWDLRGVPFSNAGVDPYHQETIQARDCGHCLLGATCVLHSWCANWLIVDVNVWAIYKPDFELKLIIISVPVKSGQHPVDDLLFRHGRINVQFF